MVFRVVVFSLCLYLANLGYHDWVDLVKRTGRSRRCPVGLTAPVRG
jgi:hypothetical protein